MNRVGLAKVFPFVASATLLACGDPLVAPELIASTRVLAARTEAAGDAQRAWVMPDEAASVRWLVASPGGAPALAWGFSACVAEAVSRGLPICSAPPFAQFTSTEVSSGEPRFDITMPDRANLGTATQIAIDGVFCASGAPALGASGVDFTATTCPDASERPLFATVNVQAELEGAANANPDFGRVSIQFDGAQWAALGEAPSGAVGCVNQLPSIPHVGAGGANHQLEFAVPIDMSEPLPGVSVHSATRETLSLAHFVTAGDLERAYSDVNLAANPALVRVNWKTPPTVDAGGALVRFYFVLSDGRDGTDYTERDVCVTP